MENEILSTTNMVEDNGYMSDAITAMIAENEKIEKMIVDEFLQKHPREESYGVYLESTEDDSEMTVYKDLTEEEIAIIEKAHEVMEEEEIYLDEYLESEGYEELRNKLLEHNTPFCLNVVKDVNLHDKHKFVKFSVRVLAEDGSLGEPVYIGFPMTDEEYKQLFTLLLERQNKLSVNQLGFLKPEFAGRLMKHISEVYYCGLGDLNKPFICEMVELKETVKSVMSPFQDELGLFARGDAKIKEYAHRHQIVPIPIEGQDVYAEHTEDDCFHCIVAMDGGEICLYQEMVHIALGEEMTWDEVDEFQCDAKELMAKFGIEKPEDIYPYLKEHFGTRDCLARVREAMTK